MSGSRTFNVFPLIVKPSSILALFSRADRHFTTTVGQLAHCNPFLPERIELERKALGDAFDPHLADWNVRPQMESDHGNLSRLLIRCEGLLNRARDRIARGKSEMEDD